MSRVEVKHHPASDGLGPEQWLVSVKTLDDCWTFLSAHNDKRGAELAAEIIEDAMLAAAKEAIQGKEKEWLAIADMAYKDGFRDGLGEAAKTARFNASLFSDPYAAHHGECIAAAIEALMDSK